MQFFSVERGWEPELGSVLSDELKAVKLLRVQTREKAKNVSILAFVLCIARFRLLWENRWSAHRSGSCFLHCVNKWNTRGDSSNGFVQSVKEGMYSFAEVTGTSPLLKGEESTLRDNEISWVCDYDIAGFWVNFTELFFLTLWTQGGEKIRAFWSSHVDLLWLLAKRKANAFFGVTLVLSLCLMLERSGYTRTALCVVV